MSPTDERYKPSALVASGLTADEAQSLSQWIESGKPGIAASKAASFAALYVLGFSCQEIAQAFPAFPLPLILYARVQGEWDKLRSAQATRIADVSTAALAAKSDAVVLLTQIVAATNAAWKSELLEYLSDPRNKEAPGFLPKTLHQYDGLLKILRELTEAPKDGKNAPAAGALAVVNVSIDAPGAALQAKTVEPAAVKEALRVSVAAKNNEPK